jgi:integrase
MKVAPQVAQVAQQKRRHSEVSVYKEPGSEVYYYRCQVHGRRFKRSTGKTNYKEALVQAKVIARELRHDGQARTTMKRPGFASVGDVLAVWLERSPAKTRGNNASTVRKWVRSFAGQDADGVSMTRLTAEELERYLRAWPGSPEGRASTWRQIRAVFAEQPMRWYRQVGLVLPEMVEFRLVRAETSAREQQFEGFSPIPAETLAAMDAAAEGLRRSPEMEERKVWAVYSLMRWCGLRNGETVDLQWEWLQRGTRHWFWRFERRAVGLEREVRMRRGAVKNGFYLPKGRSGDVPVRRRLLGELRRALDSREVGFVIPRRTRTESEVWAERAINEFVRRFVPDRPKAAYELRKQFGAEYCLRHGIEQASRVMRHGDLKTTWRHYHALLNEAAPL